VAAPKLAQATDQNFEATVLNASKPVLVDFWAAWCAPCKMLKPVVEDLAVDYGERVTIVELDVDANPGVASRFSVLSIPTLILFRDGKAAQRIVGYQPRASLKQKIDALL
jgi:thioredoxin 1